MNTQYTAGVNAFLRGEISIVTDTVMAVMTSGFEFDDTHTDETDIAGIVEDPVVVSVTGVANGTVYCNPIRFVEVPAGPAIVDGLVVYVADGPLLAHYDTRQDTLEMGVTPNGADIVFNFARLLKL